jgi:hypothetical protein
MCSTRRYGNPCGEQIVKAEGLESQLVDWIRDFQPEGDLLDLLLQTLRTDNPDSAEPAGRRNELLDQLQRLQDLYVLGDLTKAQYIMRRQALEEELQRLGPPAEPAIDQARAILDDFPRFWDLETQPAERRKLLLSLFEQVWAQEGQIVAVQPHDAFLPYFQAAQQTSQHRSGKFGAEGGSDGVRPGLCPPTYLTISRSGLSRRVPSQDLPAHSTRLGAAAEGRQTRSCFASGARARTSGRGICATGRSRSRGERPALHRVRWVAAPPPARRSPLLPSVQARGRPPLQASPRR